MNERLDGYIILYALSDYIPVMTDIEILLILEGRMVVDSDMVERWETLLKSKRNARERMFKEAYAKQR